MRTILLAQSVLVALVCGLLARPAAARTDDAALAHRLDQAVQRETLGQFWGGVLVARNGKVLLCKGYGLANESLAPIDGDTLFDVGSIAKMFTAAAVLKLESMGKLSLDDTLGSRFSDLVKAGSAKAGADITIRQLLTHTSGKSDSSGAIQSLFFDDRDKAVEKFMRSPAAAKPGEKFEYCNGGYVVLAAIVERASGKDYETAVRELVLHPAGMTHSGFLDGAGLDVSKQTTRVVSAGRGPARRGLMLDKSVEPWAWGLRGAGGLCTSLNDLLAWDAAIRDKKLLDSAAMEKWLTPGKGDYGCGWFIQRTDDGRLKQHHSGGTRGYVCEIARYPDEGIFIAVLSNENVGRLGFGLTDELAQVIWPPPPMTTSATLRFFPDLVGKYNAVELKGDVKLAAASENGSVVLTAFRVKEGDDNREVYRAVLSPAAAARLARRISNTLASGEHQKGAAGGVQFGIYGTPYKDRLAKGDTAVQVDSAAWNVMPGYSGTGEGGRPITDPRLVLVMTDDKVPGFWPVMMWLDDASAAELCSSLEKAAK